MDMHAFILALIQGLTEFLPVSSSAHLLLPKEVLGWPDQGLAFDVAVHVGTLVAVMFYFRRDLVQIVSGMFAGGEQQRSSLHLVYCLVLATIPAGLAGLLMESLIEEHLRSAAVIATTTLLGAGLLWLADRSPVSGSRSIATMSLWVALVIGLAQATALIPGTSRSGITITMALFLGLGRVEAARFSFLMSIPIIALSGGWQGLELLQQDSVAWGRMFSAMLVAGVSAFLCIRVFIQLVERMGMMPFVIYRLALGVGLILLLILS